MTATFKPENGPPQTLESGGFYAGNVDGVKLDNGNWYKVPDFTNLALTPWGTPVKWGTDNLIPDFPDLGELTDFLPGIKKSGFEDRHPDWKSKC